MTNLLPCPFCGSAATKEHIHDTKHALSGDVVSCSNNECPATPVTSGKNCVQDWNTRFSDVPVINDQYENESRN